MLLQRDRGAKKVQSHFYLERSICDMFVQDVF